MRSRRVVIAVMTVTLLTGLIATSPAIADEGDVTSNTYVEPDSVKVDISGTASVGGTIAGPGLPQWLRQCNWHEWSLLGQEVYYSQWTGAQPTAETLRADGRDPDERWNVVFCAPGPEATGVSPQIILTSILSTWAVGDPLPQAVNDWLVAYAYSLVEIPLQVGTSSPVGDVDAPMITQLDSWLWIDETVWTTRTATTPPVFGVTATVTAEPYRVEFRSSEGDYIDCGNNVGVPYNYSLPGASQSTLCSLTYRDASSVATQTLTSTIYWETTWACSSSCGSGRLPDFEITNTRDVRVAELIGVSTAIGADI